MTGTIDAPWAKHCGDGPLVLWVGPNRWGPAYRWAQGEQGVKVQVSAYVDPAAWLLQAADGRTVACSGDEAEIKAGIERMIEQGKRRAF